MEFADQLYNPVNIRFSKTMGIRDASALHSLENPDTIHSISFSATPEEARLVFAYPEYAGEAQAVPNDRARAGRLLPGGRAGKPIRGRGDIRKRAYSEEKRRKP